MQNRVHVYSSTRRAYNASQSEASDGDVLVVPSEGVVGVMVEAWPTAIDRDNCGEFHTLKPGLSFASFEGGRYRRAYKIARGALRNPRLQKRRR